MTKIKVRFEELGDYWEIDLVNEQAFGRRNEAVLVGRLREEVPRLISLIATIEKQVVGHILFSPVTVEGETAVYHSIALGPMAVLPNFQKQGVGSALIQAGLMACRAAGETAVFVLGHPTYYPRFGFKPTNTVNVDCEFKVPPDVFMVHELVPNALDGWSGTVKYHPIFREVT
jgi:putative acetyltransferase